MVWHLSIIFIYWQCGIFSFSSYLCYFVQSVTFLSRTLLLY